MSEYNKSMRAGSKYNDVKFFLIAIAFISAFNYYLTWNHIRLNWFLVWTYTIDTVQGWLGWWTARSIVIYLDKKMPYGRQPQKRILVQLVLTTGAGLLVIILLTEMVSLIARGHTAPLSFYLFDVFIILIWFFVINGIYIGLHYYQEWKASEHHRLEEKKIRVNGYTVKQGKQNLLIPFEEISGFYSEDGYSILLNSRNKKYFPDKSLDKIEKELPQEWFFRLNRQYIVHRNAITGFKRTNDGKLDVTIRKLENLPETVQVSRTKAIVFKKWFQQEEEG